jgi:hypothetical protein
VDVGTRFSISLPLVVPAQTLKHGETYEATRFDH